MSFDGAVGADVELPVVETSWLFVTTAVLTARTSIVSAQGMAHAWLFPAATLCFLACSGDAGTAFTGSGSANTGGSTSTSTGVNNGSGGNANSGGTTSAGGGSTGSATGGGAAAGSGGGSSKGCGNTGAPTGVMNNDIQANDKARTYVLSVPESYNASTPLALVFAWHGLGGAGALARQYFGVEEQSAGQAIVVYPNGLIVMGNTGWDLTTNGDDVQLFDAIVAELEEIYCIDSARIFSTGHSFGGYFSNALGCARANVLRAIAPVASGGPFQINCSGALAAWITHGTNDNIVNFSQGEGSRDRWIAENGCTDSSSPVTPTPCVAYDGCTAGADVHWCAHSGLHEWPGFAAAGIWDFFASMP